MIGQWSRFYKFWEIYEYLGHFDESGESRRGKVLFDGSEGVPHSDGGFRLRSTMGGHLSFSNIPLKTSLETFPCPLERGDIGCYFVRVRVEDTVWDYIGKSAELKKGISDRLREHLIKIAGTTSIHHVTPTRKFSSLNAELRTDFHLNPNTSGFFDDHVELAFIKVDRTAAEYEQHVSKIEGMALAKYREMVGEFPRLNSTDETRGLLGLEDLLIPW